MNEKVKKPFYKKKWFIAIIVIVVLAIIGSFMGGGDSEPAEDPAIRSFADKNEVSFEYAEDIFKVAESIDMDMGDLYVRNVNGEDITAEYWDYKIHIIGKDDKVTAISSTQGIFYEDGEAQNKVGDLLMTQDEWTQIMVAAQMDVEDILKSPTSAEHPERDEYVIVRDGQKYEVNSYVDADNSFGAKIRTYYVATYKWDKDPDKRPTLQSIEPIEN